MSDLAATHCDRGVGGFNDCGWIIFLILILVCCNGNNGIFGGRDCHGDDNCGFIIIILLILCCCNGNGFGCF